MPNQLVLEITETVPVVDLADAASAITRLNGMGVKVALDDFGADHQARPRSDGRLRARSDRTLYRSVIRLCDALDLAVIAVGIESTAQADTVYAAGTRMAHGHLFGRAAPITNISFPGAVSGTVGPCAALHVRSPGWTNLMC